jgi:septal ring factor EnvC (AmiA/AmiB activator)
MLMTHSAAAFAVLWLALAPAAVAQQSDRAEAEALSRRAAERLQALRREADRLAAEERTLLGDLRKLELERQIKTTELGRVEADVARVSRDLRANDDRIREIEQQVAAAEPVLRSRLVQMYKLGRGQYLRLLLSAADLRQIGQATRMVAALARLDRDRIAAQRQRITELTSARATLEQRRTELRTLRAETARAQAAAERAAAARNDLIADIDRRRDLNAQLVGELQIAQTKLQDTLRDLDAGAAVTAIDLPVRPFRGDLEWPVQGRLVRRPAAAGGASAGIAIAAPEGTAVSAIHGGEVAFAGAFVGFGNLVILDHGSRIFSLYGDLLETSVRQGDRVAAGQPVGTVGSAPNGQPELYFELRVDGATVDPLQWLKRR